MELKNLHIMNGEEYKKYILDKMPDMSADIKYSALEKFNFTKTELSMLYGHKTFAVISEIDSTMPEKSIIKVQGLTFYVLAPNVVMAANSIRDEKLYTEDDLEEFEGDDIFEFLNGKLEDLMIKHVWAMNPEVDAEHVHPEEG